MSQVVGLPTNSYKPITNTRGFAPGYVNKIKWCIRLAAASDKVYQMLAHGRWFSPGPPASSTKTGRHDIAEILLKVALKHQKSKIILLTALVPPYNPSSIIHKIYNINIELFCRCVFLSSFNFRFYLRCKLRRRQKRKCLLESQTDFNELIGVVYRNESH